VFADGQRLLTGSQAVHHKGERGYRENFKRILGQVSTLLLGEDMYWPEQLVGAMIQALKEAAEEYGPLARTVITIPASYAPRDRTRKLMIGER
jgi:molecular chaperone DnaK (HSP70)